MCILNFTLVGKDFLNVRIQESIINKRKSIYPKQAGAEVVKSNISHQLIVGYVQDHG